MVIIGGRTEEVLLGLAAAGDVGDGPFIVLVQMNEGRRWRRAYPAVPKAARVLADAFPVDGVAAAKAAGALYYSVFHRASASVVVHSPSPVLGPDAETFNLLPMPEYGRVCAGCASDFAKDAAYCGECLRDARKLRGRGKMN